MNGKGDRIGIGKVFDFLLGVNTHMSRNEKEIKAEDILDTVGFEYAVSSNQMTLLKLGKCFIIVIV